MKRKDGDINWNNFATPVLRPKRNYEADSKIVSRERMENTL